MSQQPVRFGRYLLVELLGAGGMAEVWRGRMEGANGFSRDLVIKRIRAPNRDRADFAQLFAREARLSARLHHANVVQVFEYGEVEGEPYLAMEYVTGLDLQRLLSKTRAPLPVGLACYIAREVGRALQHVHEATDEQGQPLGLVHRDVSPSNVMLGLDGSVKLFDFGVARSSQEAPLTQPESFRGKLSYAAPEVVEGRPHDAKSDLFALGIVTYEMLAGRRLFAGSSDTETFSKVLSAAAPLLSTVVPGVPPEVEALVHRLLAREPGDRPESAAEFVAAVDPVVLRLHAGPRQLAEVVGPLVPPRRESSPVLATVASAPTFDVSLSELTSPSKLGPPVAPRARRWPVVAAVMAAVTLVAGAAVWVVGGRRTEAPTPSVAPVVVAKPDAATPVQASGGGEDAGPAVVVEATVKVAPAPRLEVRSVPPGATVKTDDGRTLGTTPLSLAWPGDATHPVVVQVSRRGYQPVTARIAPEAPQLTVTLRPARGAVATPNLKEGQVIDPFR